MQYSNKHVSTFKKPISTHNMECTLAGRKTSSKNLPGGPLVSEEFLVLPGDKDIDSYLDGNSDEPGEMGFLALGRCKNASRNGEICH